MAEGTLGGRVLVVAFAGWNDAGDAASNAVTALRDELNLEQVSSVDPEDYFDYQFTRPQVRTDEDGSRSIEWPGASVYAPTDGGDVHVLLGSEPSRNWKTFVSEIVEVIEDRDIHSVVMLGAMLADVPHTRPISVFVTSENSEVRRELELERSSYEGPVGILSVLGDACEKADIPAVMVWASVPHYVHSVPSPKATLALLDKVCELTGVDVPREQLSTEAVAWVDSIDALAGDDDEMASYIEQLERARDTVDSPEASGDAIAEEFEKYLRRRGDGGKADGRGKGGL